MIRVDRERPLLRNAGGVRSSGGVLILATAIVVLLAGIAQVIVGAISIGVTLDEPTHVARLQGLIGEGWYVPPVFLTDTGPGSVPEASPYVYGPAYSWFRTAKASPGGCDGCFRLWSWL